MVGFGGQEVGEEPEVGVGGLAKGLVDPVGEFGLFGGQGEPGHGSPPWTDDDEIWEDPSEGSVVRNFPPTIETPTQVKPGERFPLSSGVVEGFNHRVKLRMGK